MRVWVCGPLLRKNKMNGVVRAKCTIKIRRIEVWDTALVAVFVVRCIPV